MDKGLHEIKLMAKITKINFKTDTRKTKKAIFNTLKMANPGRFI